MPTIIERIKARLTGDRTIPLQLETSATAPANAPVATVPRRTGSETGWMDPNAKFTPTVLYGDATTPGLLWGVRSTDDVIQPAADARRELLQSLEYGVVPPRRLEGDPTAQACAVASGAILSNMRTRTLPAFVAESYDYTSTIGNSLWEMVWDDATNQLDLNYIRRGLVVRWEQDETGYGWSRAQVRNSRGVGWVDAWKCAYFARNPLPGQFDGQSAYRCLLAPYTQTYELTRRLLEAMQYARGYMHAIAKPGASVEDKNSALAFMRQLVDGVAEGVFTSENIEFKILTSQVPALQSFAPLAQSFAEAKNRAALNALSNIGMSSHGSRALAEVVQEADQTRLRAHLDAHMDTISGDNTRNGTLMRAVAQMAGYPPEYAGRIVVRWTDDASRLTREHTEQIAELVERQIIQSSPQLRSYLAKGAGIPSEVAETLE